MYYINSGLNSFHSLGNMCAGNKEVNVVLYLLQCANCCCLVGGLSSIVKYVRFSNEIGSLLCLS